MPVDLAGPDRTSGRPRVFVIDWVNASRQEALPADFVGTCDDLPDAALRELSRTRRGRNPPTMRSGMAG